MREYTYREWKGWRRDRFFTTGDEERAYYRAELAACGVDGARRLSVLEIGFGNAGFARYCRDVGWSYVGTELDLDLVEQARASGIEALESSRSIPDALAERTVDLVVAFDVFEHVPADDLVALLHDLGRVLKPGGLIVARFPNGDSPFSAPLYNGDMTHRTLIGTGKLNQLARSAGLRVVRCHAQTTPLAGLGLAHRLRKAPGVLARALVSRAIGLLYHGSRHFVADPNLIAVLAADGADPSRREEPAPRGCRVTA